MTRFATYQSFVMAVIAGLLTPALTAVAEQPDVRGRSNDTSQVDGDGTDEGLDASVDVHDEVYSDSAEGDRRRDSGSGLPDCPDVVQTRELAYETEGLDFETGDVFEIDPSAWWFDESVDFSFAYNADTKSHMRVFPQYPTVVGLLEMPFQQLTCDDVQTVSFSMDPDTEIYRNDTLVVLTPDGHYFKMSHFRETRSGTVLFDYAEMCVACDADETGGFDNQEPDSTHR